VLCTSSSTTLSTLVHGSVHTVIHSVRWHGAHALCGRRASDLHECCLSRERAVDVLRRCVHRERLGPFLNTRQFGVVHILTHSVHDVTTTGAHDLRSVDSRRLRRSGIDGLRGIALLAWVVSRRTVSRGPFSHGEECPLTARALCQAPTTIQCSRCITARVVKAQRPVPVFAVKHRDVARQAQGLPRRCSPGGHAYPLLLRIEARRARCHSIAERIGALPSVSRETSCAEALMEATGAVAS